MGGQRWRHRIVNERLRQPSGPARSGRPRLDIFHAGIEPCICGIAGHCDILVASRK
jgi:hypothetical protein